MASLLTQYKASWHQWVHQRFLKGKTSAVYFLMVNIAISVYLLSMHHVANYTFYPILIMTMFSYGVFTDLVAHLWWDGIDTGISWSKFVKYVFTGRWHDGYGIIVFIIVDVIQAHYVYDLIDAILGLIAGGMAIAILFALIHTKFYH